MNYEEKYKEALKRADSLTEKYGGREFAEYVFPELAKSEDGMIREAIIGIIKNSNIIDINVSEEKMIAYLEKQKEQKPEWSEEDEEMLKDIIAEIEATKQYFFSHDSEGGAQMQARIEWLKSLRPSWKPSEGVEQVAARYERENRQSALSSVDIVNAFIEGARWKEGR